MLTYGRAPVLPIDTVLQLPENPPKSLQAHLEKTLQTAQLCRKWAQEHLERNQANMKKFYDRRASTKEFRLGDDVWLYYPNLKLNQITKLAHKWHGPFYISEQLSAVSFKLKRTADNKPMSVPVHANRLKYAWARHLHRPKDSQVPQLDAADDLTLTPGDLPLDSLAQADPSSNARLHQARTASKPAGHQNPQVQPAAAEPEPKPPDQDGGQQQDNVTEDSDNNDDKEYTVRKIIRGRYHKGRPQYLIHWKGFSKADRTWEPLENLNETARAYLKKHPVTMTGKPPKTRHT
jgi:hypothetical protein